MAGVALGHIHLRFAWQAWHLETSTCVLRDKIGTWLLPFCVAELGLGYCHLRSAWQASPGAASLSHTSFTHHLCQTLSFTQLCHTPSFTHNIVTHHLSHTTLSHTIFHTQLVTHNFVTHHLSHTTFHTQLCHTPSFTHNFVAHHLSHTTLSHTIFHTELVTHNFVTHNLSHDYMPGMITSQRAFRKSSQNLRMRSKECRTLLWSAEVW